MLPLPACGTLGELEARMNDTLAAADWGYVRLSFDPGSHTVMVMCTNTAGVSQPAQANWNPGGLMRNVIESVTLKLS